VTTAALALGLAGGLVAMGGFPIPAALLEIGAVVLAARPLRPFDSQGSPRVPPSGRLERRLIYVCLAVAAVCRFWDIAGTPPGIWIDEGRMGWWALRFLRGASWWAMPEGPEPLGLFITGFAFKWFGGTLVVERCAMALVGTLTVPVLWWALRPVYGAGIAVAAAGCLAISRWHILVSRLGAPYVLLPVGFLIAVGALVRAWRSRRPVVWAAAGACLGAALYTYLPARAIPVILAGAIGWAAWRRSRRPKTDAEFPRTRELLVRLVMIWGAAFVIVTAPVLIHFWRVPVAWSLRFIDIAGPFLASPVHEGARRLAGTLAALTVRGDGHVVFNYPFGGNWPVAGAAGIALLCVGVTAVARPYPAFWNALLGLTAAAFVAVGTVTGFSHVRSVCMIPLVCLVQACGLVRVALVAGATAGFRADARNPWAGRWGGVVAAVLVVGMAVQEAGGFFTRRLQWADPAAVNAEYLVADLEVARQVKELAREHPVYLSPETANPSLAYEWVVAHQLFLMDPWVRPEPVRDLRALARDGGVAVAIAADQRRVELIEDLVPGGKFMVVQGPWGPGTGQALYVMTPELVPKAQFGEVAYLVGRDEALDALCKAGRDREGLAEADRVVARVPTVAGFRVWRAYFRLAVDPAADVRAELERALASVHGRSSRALMLLGVVAVRRGDYPGAIRWWEACARLDPRNEVVRQNLVSAYLRLGRAYRLSP